MTTYERATHWLSRILCHFNYHSLACRGRINHDPEAGRWTVRW